MTQTAEARAVTVSVDELKRAWSAVAAGQFRSHTCATQHRPGLASPPAGKEWGPGPGERVLPVIGCTGSCGASTISLALALAAAQPARVLECSTAGASGLAAASTAELGLHESGWTRGTRDGVLIERACDVLVSIQEVPTPSAPDRTIALSVLDVGWEIGQVLATPAWLGDQVRAAEFVVLVSTATVPGLRRLEGALDLLAGSNICAAVIGPKPKKWPRQVGHSAGPRTRGLEAAGRLVDVPDDRMLAVAGLDATPLPPPVLAAATTLLGLFPDAGSTTKGDTP